MQPFWKQENCPSEQRSRRRRSAGKRVKREPKERWKWIRILVFERDDWTCQYCGKRRAQALLQVDHIVPIASGGSNKMFNLVTACQPCNTGKGATNLPRGKRRAVMDALMRRYRARLAAEAKLLPEKQGLDSDYERAMSRD